MEAAKAEYLKLFESLSNINQSFDFSIKLSQLGLDIDREFWTVNLKQLARALGNHTIRLDMADSTRTQNTLKICEEVHNTYHHNGQAIQAYLFHSENDVHHCIDNRIFIRLCKSAHKKHPDVALQSMDKIREKFFKLACQIYKEEYQPAIATHYENLLVKLLGFIRQEKINPNFFILKCCMESEEIYKNT